jgi:hypothetical protein
MNKFLTLCLTLTLYASEPLTPRLPRYLLHRPTPIVPMRDADIKAWESAWGKSSSLVYIPVYLQKRVTSILAEIARTRATQHITIYGNRVLHGYDPHIDYD